MTGRELMELLLSKRLENDEVSVNLETVNGKKELRLFVGSELIFTGTQEVANPLRITNDDLFAFLLHIISCFRFSKIECLNGKVDCAAKSGNEILKYISREIIFSDKEYKFYYPVEDKVLTKVVNKENFIKGCTDFFTNNSKYFSKHFGVQVDNITKNECMKFWNDCLQ